MPLRKQNVPETLSSRGDRYDVQTLEVMRRCIGQNSLCLDIGAHEGYFLARMQALAPGASHYAFEPLPHLASELQIRFPRAEVLPYALSDHTGDEPFCFVRNDPGYSGLRRRTYDRHDVEIELLRVPVRRLDDVVPEDKNVTFIKLDVEGGEYHALRGGIQTVRRSNPVIVFEAGEKSTGHYGVTPEDLFRLVTVELGLCLSTMEAWLSQDEPFSLSEFLESYTRDFYFIAYPKS